MINSILKYIKIIVKSNISVLLLFSLLTILVFYPALSNGFMGDDFGQIVSNPFIRSLKNIPLFFHGGTFYLGGIDNGLSSDYYRPLMVVWYSLMYYFFKLNAFYFHLFQLPLHIANSILVYFLLKKLLLDNKLSRLLALIFLLHPIQTEALAHLANVQDLLFFFFGILGFYLFLRKTPSYTTLFYALTLLLLSLLSKEIGLVSFIILYLYMDIYRVPKQIYRLYIVGSGATILVYVYMRCFIAHICTLGDGGTGVVPIARMNFFERMQQVPAEIYYYIKTLFFPLSLAAYQQWIVDRSINDFYIPLLIVVVFLTIIITVPFFIYFNRSNLPASITKKWFFQNAAAAKTYTFFLCWFLVGLTAHIHIIPLDSTVAERWFYFPFVGILGLSGVLINLIKDKKNVYFVLTILIVLFAIRSHIRALDWSDPSRLYSKDIRISKNSAGLENNYGAVLFKKKDYKNAEVHFRNAIRLTPKSPIYLYNLAQVYEIKKDYKNAEKYYLKSIKYGKFYIAFERYTDLLLSQGRKKEAVQFLKEKALKTFPHNSLLNSLYERISKT